MLVYLVQFFQARGQTHFREPPAASSLSTKLRQSHLPAQKLHSSLSFCCFPSRSLCSSQLPGCLAFKQMAPIKVTTSIWVATALWSHWAEVGRRLAQLFQAVVVYVSGSQKRKCRVGFLSLSFSMSYERLIKRGHKSLVLMHGRPSGGEGSDK